jgi:hypothetical protein
MLLGGELAHKEELQLQGPSADSRQSPLQKAKQGRDAISPPCEKRMGRKSFVLEAKPNG